MLRSLSRESSSAECTSTEPFVVWGGRGIVAILMSLAGSYSLHYRRSLVDKFNDNGSRIFFDQISMRVLLFYNNANVDNSNSVAFQNHMTGEGAKSKEQRASAWIQ